MEYSVIERIREVLLEKGISITSFSKTVGLTQSTVNRQLKGETQLSSETIEAFLHCFDDISAEWLLRNDGSKERVKQEIGNVQNSSAIGNNVNGSGNSISHNDLSEIVDVQKKYISLLQNKDEQINRLLNIIEKISYSNE